MPKQPSDTPASGSFADLYEAMQQRRPSPTSNGGRRASEEPTGDAPQGTPRAKQPHAPPVSRDEASQSHKQASNHASVLANDDLIATLRRTIRVAGKEVVYVRLTPGEKAELADIVYNYKRRGQRTSDTEISRIAVNYLVQDFKANGEGSILARVLASLLS